MMLATPWAVAAMPPVVWSNLDLPAERFVHLVTQVAPDVQNLRSRRGQTMWYARIDNLDGALAWDWVEIRGGVFTLVDPMSVVSNISIQPNCEGADSERIVILNEWVHRIPWQRVVSAAVDGLAQ